MRLTVQERAAVADAARATMPPGTRVSLFGSRVDDAARGGDIDLLVETAGPMDPTEWVARRLAFVSRLYRSIGERRIDVVMTPSDAAAPPPIVASARRHAVAVVHT